MVIGQLEKDDTLWLHLIKRKGRKEKKKKFDMIIVKLTKKTGSFVESTRH